MRFGFHISIVGGFSGIVDRARRVHCQTIQFFTRSPRGWSARPLDPADVAGFRERLRRSGMGPAFVHAPYLPNLATAEPGLAARTVAALAEDMERCQQLGVGFLIAHVGRSADQVEALERVARNVDVVLERGPAGVMLLLENTAGMGSEVGWSFDQLSGIIGRVGAPDRVGVVLDTAHLFEAGYELRTRDGLDETLRDFDRLVGLGRLYLLHLNDSKTGLGSRIDRHWHIGKGEIGRSGFRLLVNHPLLAGLPGIMETPRRSHRDDLANLRSVRRLVN